MEILEDPRNDPKSPDEKIDEFVEKILDSCSGHTKIGEEIGKAKDENPKNKYEYLVGKYWYFKEERADTTVEVYLKANDVFHEVIYRYDIVSCEIIQMCHTNNTNELEWFDYTKEQSFELAKYYDMGYKIPIDELKETTEEKFILAKQLSLL